MGYHCYVELADENSAILVSEWETRDDWDNHLRSRDFAILLGALNVLASPANIDFKLLSKIAGIESLPMRMQFESQIKTV